VFARTFVVAGMTSVLLACSHSAGAPRAPAAPVAGASAANPIRLQQVVGGLNQPLYVTMPPGDTTRLFIVEKGGRIRLVTGGRLLPAPFLDISAQVSTGGEQGLLSMAFDPNYATNGRFFVSYTDTAGDSRVAAYHRLSGHPNRANPFTKRIIFKAAQPFSNHNGGQLQFGPGGMLFLGLGDGGSEGDPNNNGQRRIGWLSKLIRINVNLPTPRAQIYAYGLRNPWRFSFDRLTGALWIGDVGQGSWEEIDHLPPATPAGTNFGWSYYEGTHVFKTQPIDRSRLVFPVAQYPHNPGGNCSVTGGYVYRASNIPSLYGWYVYADFCSGRVWKIHGPSGTPSLMAISGRVHSISSFGEGAGGGLFLVSLNGTVYRFLPPLP
jgi:glucose/arabinose dehydrogenase